VQEPLASLNFSGQHEALRDATIITGIIG